MLIETGIGEFSDAQALTSGTSASTNVLNIGVARHQFGADSLWLILRTNVAAAFDSTQTYIFNFETATADFSGSLNAAVVVSDADGTGIVTADEESTRLKTAGLLIYASTLPYAADQQYARWNYILVNGGGTATITVDAWLGLDRPTENRAKSQVYSSNVGDP